ncbi:MAG TPA: biotin/lipoyl-containing protein [Candidatus Limnocylindrales bacterium]|nr:biotin/lipoyl-containing protein [Candidatus Limnocylindrales bacterium]
MADDELLTLIDRLEAVLAGSELDELEVEVGATSLRLRRLGAPDPQAAAPGPNADAAGSSGAGSSGAPGSSGPGASGARGSSGAGSSGADASGASGAADPASDRTGEAEAPTSHQVLAPLTGIYYGSPSPDAAAYVEVGTEIQAGQVIGLIEAMKLFNEIKSDVRGRVVRIVAENGQLIKARQPLIEVAPA